MWHFNNNLQNTTDRALPDQILKYKHAILIYKLIWTCMPEEESNQMNFNANQNDSMIHQNFIKTQNYCVGQNILLNRLCVLNDWIEKTWLDLSLQSYKIKCKEEFLQPRNLIG